MAQRAHTSVRQRLAQMLLSKQRHRRYVALLVLLAVVVGLGTARAMSLTGVAMTHEETVLDCHYAGNGAHTHNADCYDAAGNLVCPLPERQLHTHTDACYDADGNLICGQEEITEEHVHSAACFTTITVQDPDPEPEPESVAAPEQASATTAESQPETTVSDPQTDSTDADANAQTDSTDSSNDSTTSKASATKPAEVTTSTLNFSDSTLQVTAKVTASTLPNNARLQVTQITPSTQGYNYDAYMEALQSEATGANADNTLLYDVAIMDGANEWEPAEGETVQLSLRFVNDQLADQLGVEDAATLSVTHLPLDADIMASHDSTRTATDITSADITPEPVDATINADATRVSFELNSLSAIAITNASSTVNVNISLSGDYDANSMLLKSKNVYAYLVPTNVGSWIYGAKLNFAADGSASCTITGVPDNDVQDYNTSFDLVLAYKEGDGTLNTGRTGYSTVTDSGVHKITEGSTLYGFTYHEPTTYTQNGNTYTVNAQLSLPEISNGNFSLKTLMDTSINYGITASAIDYRVGSYANYATKDLTITNSNANGGTVYSSRADGVKVVPNIIANINYDGLKLTSADKPSNYYVTEKDQDKVNSTNTTDTIIRNDHEIYDRVEIMISNTCKQAEQLATMNMAKLPSCTSVDTTAYADNATIILDATAISGEQNGFTIYKRPGQTIVFNIGGTNAAPPQNTKVVLVDDNGNQTGTWIAGDQMRNAPASDGDVWNKLIWNFPDATSVTATNQIGGIFLVPKGDFNAANKGGGWIVARGKVSVTNEWYGFPGDDEPFKRRVIRKTFVGVEASDIRSDYALKLWTHVNDSTTGTTHEELITSLLLKPETDETLVKDPSGTNDQTGYHTSGTDTDGNVYYEWITPPLSVGNEHKLTEVNATSTNGVGPQRVEFTGPYSAWNEASQNYEWISRSFNYTSADELAGVFNVSKNDEDWRKNVFVRNIYTDKNDLFVKKLVKGTEPSPAPEYAFEITLCDPNGTVVTKDITHVNDMSVKYKKKNLTTGAEGAEQTLTLAPVEPLTIGQPVTYKGTFTLTSNQQIELEELPQGCTYTVSEQADANAAFTTTYAVGLVAVDGTSVSGQIDGSQTVTVTNTYPVTTKDLVFSKTITDASGTAWSQLRDQGFAVHVDNTADAEDTHTLKLDDADVTCTATTGEYRYEWTIKDVPIGVTYRVTESGADLASYLQTSSVSVDGEAPHAVSGQEKLTVNDTTDQQGAAFVNSYEKVQDSSTQLRAKKVLLDADGNAISLVDGQFTFVAQPCDETGEAASGDSLTATNAVNGLVQFDVPSDLASGDHWYLLTENAGTDSDMTYSTERYLACVHVPEVVAGPMFTVKSATGSISLVVSFPADAGEYRILESATNTWSPFSAVQLTSPGVVSIDIGSRVYNQTNHFYIAKMGNGGSTIDELLYELTVIGYYPQGSGTLMLGDYSWVAMGSGGSGSAAGEPTITYYQLAADGTKTKIASIPTFTNRLKPEVTVALRGRKVGVDNVALPDAEFTLEGQDGTLVSGEGGLFTIASGLAAGDYYLTETKAPDGYNKLEHRIKISVQEDGKVQAMSDVAENAANYEVEGPDADGVYTIVIPNNPGVELPQTGGAGTGAFTACGVAMIAAAACIFALKRRLA